MFKRKYTCAVTCWNCRCASVYYKLPTVTTRKISCFVLCTRTRNACFCKFYKDKFLPSYTAFTCTTVQEMLCAKSYNAKVLACLYLLTVKIPHAVDAYWRQFPPSGAYLTIVISDMPQINEHVANNGLRKQEMSHVRYVILYCFQCRTSVNTARKDSWVNFSTIMISV